MKVLFISRFVDPSPVGSNTNVYRQAKYLNENAVDIDVEILTWPLNDHWSGPTPKKTCPIPPLKAEREGLIYHVIAAPLAWNEVTCVIDDKSWEKAVLYGIKVLKALRPDIVHLQHRHGLWWLLDSAQRLNIPTVYSNHDWGLACLRTVLVKSDGSLCDGVVEPSKCADCFRQRSSAIGLLNEKVAENIVGSMSLRVAKKTPLLGKALIQKNVVFESALARSNRNYTRAKNVISKLRWCFTPSKFGAGFFKRMGCELDRITILPWYHDPVEENHTSMNDQPFIITFIGRISPEKGLQEIFSALEKLTCIDPIILRIVGAVNSEYAVTLKSQYAKFVGCHSVEWKGWSEVEPFILSTDAVIIPSQVMDNTPLVLIESLAYRVPVIVTNIPTITDLVQEGASGFFAEYKNSYSLSDAIRRAVSKKDAIRSDSLVFPGIISLGEYMARVIDVYDNIYQNSTTSKK